MQEVFLCNVGKTHAFVNNILFLLLHEDTWIQIKVILSVMQSRHHILFFYAVKHFRTSVYLSLLCRKTGNQILESKERERERGVCITSKASGRRVPWFWLKRSLEEREFMEYIWGENRRWHCIILKYQWIAVSFFGVILGNARWE